MYYQSNRMYKYNYSGKDDGEAANQNTKSNNEKWKNLNFVVIHKFQFL